MSRHACLCPDKRTAPSLRATSLHPTCGRYSRWRLALTMPTAIGRRSASVAWAGRQRVRRCARAGLSPAPRQAASCTMIGWMVCRRQSALVAQMARRLLALAALIFGEAHRDVHQPDARLRGVVVADLPPDYLARLPRSDLR